MGVEVKARKKRRSERGNWLVVSYCDQRIVFCRWVRTWAGVQMSKRNAERHIPPPQFGKATRGRVIVMDIERMAAFAITEAANEIHDLYRLFEK